MIRDTQSDIKHLHLSIFSPTHTHNYNTTLYNFYAEEEKHVDKIITIIHRPINTTLCKKIKQTLQSKPEPSDCTTPTSATRRATLNSNAHMYCTVLHLELFVSGGVVGVLLQESDNILQLATLLVLHRVGLVVALEEHQCGEPLDSQAGDINLVGGGVHLGDHNVLVVLELGTKLIPHRGELFAVAAPGGVELHEHILVVVQHQVSEGGAAQHHHIAGGVVGSDLLGLQGGLQGAVNEGLHEGGDGGSIHGTSERVLLDATLVAKVGQHGGGELGGGDAEVIEDLVLGTRHVDEEQLALEASGGGREGGVGGSVVVGVLVGEEQHVLLDRRAEDLLGRLGGEGLHQGHGVGGDEAVHLLGLEGSANGVVVAQLVEGLQHHHGVLSHGKLGLHRGAGGDGVGVHLVAVGHGHECLGSLRVSAAEHTDHEDLVLLLELGEVIFGGQGYGSGARLLVDPVDDLSGSAAAVVVGGLAGLEVLDGGESLHVEALGQGVVLGGVHLCELDSGVLEGLGGLCPLRSKGLAVTAPRKRKERRREK
jgi:hypothetical protein